MNTQRMESLPTEDLENHVIKLAAAGRSYRLSHVTCEWIMDAVKELQLRRLAMSAP